MVNVRSLLSDIWFPPVSVAITSTRAWVVGLLGIIQVYEVLFADRFIAIGTQLAPLLVVYLRA